MSLPTSRNSVSSQKDTETDEKDSLSDLTLSQPSITEKLTAKEGVVKEV